LYLEPIGYQWFILAALTLISGSATVKLPSSYASISISETFVFTAVLLYGPAAGTLIVALDALVISFWIAKRHDEPYRALFNMSAPAISAWLSAHLFFRVAHISPLVEAPATLDAILPALILFALTYFGLNSWLITLVIALERKLNPLRVWTSTFVWLSLNYFGGASVAILFVGYNRTIDLGYVGVIVPLLLVLWFTFKTTMGRVEDADRHVEQLNRLYLSTIETLAMAIDAKDQVTHGHIRRVQTHAVSLARSLGVRDDALLKAIEAAALLHDMGKLAVPEYILNKPGKLTVAEFEKMKLHASVGADILSAIEFPYPVVPIVRHHHENWDGNGYTDGLRGTDIPIGARILSVVDCFDALTSDRPYRPRLSDDEAIAILSERRGTMYDPLVVDTFIAVHQEETTESITTSPATAAISELTTARAATMARMDSPVLDEIAASTDEMLTLYELARALGSSESASNAADIAAKHLKRLLPSSLCIFFLYDKSSAELQATYTSGEGAEAIKGLRIEVGQRLSGWVAANRQTIVNSDPILDLGDIARHQGSGRLRSCISTPILIDDDLVGVLSLYTQEPSRFNDDHRRIIQAIAQLVAPTMRRASADVTATRDILLSLPSMAKLDQFISQNPDAALIAIKVLNLTQIKERHGSDAARDALRHAARQAYKGLRSGDILFRPEADEFVALLTSAQPDTAPTVAHRINSAVIDSVLTLKGAINISIDVSIRVIAFRTGDSSVDSLLEAVKQSTQLQNLVFRSGIH
jgi:diguanylate cyclase (GGDEF)-like protein/putative nucleotidyltransferase with HDIG domain